MTARRHVITRRDFIRTGTCVAMGSLMGFPVVSEEAAKPIAKSRVILIRDKQVIGSDGSLKETLLENLLDEATAHLLKTPEPASAWQELFRPNDIVGIKTNGWGPLPTPAALESALRNRLQEAGVKPENIAVDDRGIRNNPVFQSATALVNIRPMRTHHWAGLGTLLKNYIMFVSQPWTYHGNACERLGEIWTKPRIKGKTRLNILVMLTPLFHGIGPHHFSKRYVWPYRGLIVSTDPVAADATGARIIQAKRNDYFNEYRPVSPPPRHIQAADATFGLGNSRPDNIELVKLGWDADSYV